MAYWTRRVVLAGVAVWVALGALRIGSAQMPNFQQPQGERMDAEKALDRALKASSLTFEGKPFHAVMEISSEKAGPEYTGRVEVWWVEVAKYKLVLTSAHFSQTRVVNGDRVYEKNDGDYYPRWLENFVLAVLDPVPMAKNFQIQGPQVSAECLKRENRPNGIRDELTFAVICLKANEPQVDYALTFNYFMEFKDAQAFGEKRVARNYETRILSFQPIIGHLTYLEELRPVDESVFAIDQVTPVERRIVTTLVSTLKEESLLEKTPVIEWPGVREGKTEGYMIVYARTDGTGQVRETAKHNSDQPGLEQFGMEQALRYKFEPLVVDGVAQQMEMPLVLHFVSKRGDPLPYLYGEELLKQISNCAATLVIVNSSSSGIRPTTISVNEVGKLTGEGTLPLGVALKLPAVLISAPDSLFSCRFAPLVINGVPSYYHGQLLVEHR